MVNAVSQLISPQYFFKKFLRPTSNQVGVITLEHLGKSWENMKNKITMQPLASYRKK